MAEATKNFSGAELEGLINSAASFALERGMKSSRRAEKQPGDVTGVPGEVTGDPGDMQVTMEDFWGALREVVPALGTRAAHLTVSAPALPLVRRENIPAFPASDWTRAAHLTVSAPALPSITIRTWCSTTRLANTLGGKKRRGTLT
eukprot:4388875-Pyramimonas_sp.AAC.1